MRNHLIAFNIKCVLSGIAVLFAGWPLAVSCDPVWDILDEKYGSGVSDGNEVSFNACYDYLFGSVAPAEERYDGFVRLTLGQGSGYHYPCRPLLAAMPTGDSDITLEFKVRTADRTPLMLYASHTNSTATSSWNHIIQINQVYQQKLPDTIADYNQRDTAKSIAPYGFNSAVVHTYRLVRQSGVSHLYIYDTGAPIHLAALKTGAGAAGDLMHLEWGFTQDASKEAVIDFYHLKIGQGADPIYDPVTMMRCGDPGTVYLPSDFNQDCRVNLYDLSAMNEAWLHCTDPHDPQCDKYWRYECLDVSNEKQLLIDGMFFDEVSGIVIGINPPVKTGEYNLRRETPWESATLNWFNVMEDQGTYKMWYECYDIEGWPTADDTSFCYAESTDGISWTRPNLGLFTYQGSDQNNILFRQIGPADGYSRVHGTGVFRDDIGGSQARYKAVSQGIWDVLGHRVTGMYSADGLHWTRYPAPITEDFADSQYSGFWDTERSKYVIYGRSSSPNGRSLGRSESGSFDSFPKLTLVLAPDDNEPDRADFYNSAAMKYPYASHAYFMFMSYFMRDLNKIDIRLAVSRDGITWSRPNQDTPFIANGAAGAFDAGTIYMGQGILRVGNELWQYYGGSPLGHDGNDLEDLLEPNNGRTYSRVISRLDGYVSAKAGDAEGWFITKPMYYDGSTLKLNVKVHSGGYVRVGLLDMDGHALAGHATDQCAEITADDTAMTVSWSGGADISAYAGQVVRLHVIMRNADLYAFQFTEE